MTAHVESDVVARADLAFGMRHYKNQEEYAAAVQQMDMLARVLERGAADQAREELRASGRSSEDADWRQALDSGMLESIRAGHVDEAKETLRACLWS